MIQHNSVSIVVIGERGSGKSSLINLVMNKEIAKVGDDLNGVTKDITKYKTQLGQNILELVLYDIPGFGDIDISLDVLTQQWNSKFSNQQIDIIFYCHNISNTRMAEITRNGLNIYQQYEKIDDREENFYSRYSR